MEAKSSARSGFLDAVRGMAMLLVCASHFGMYFSQLGNFGADRLLKTIAAPSTPLFVLLSGVLLGFLYRSTTSFPSLAVKLMDRGLFLLLPAHFLIRLAHMAAYPTVHFFFITDAIGVCLLFGPWLVSNLSGRARIAIGIGMLAVTWSVYFAWTPASALGMGINAIFIGRPPMTNGWLTFPTLPWFGFYLLATPLGERLATWKKAGPGFTSKLAQLGLGALALGLALMAVGHRGPAPLHLLLGMRQKYPPSAPYLLLSAGLALGLTAVVALLEQRHLFETLIAGFAIVGRSSLVVFVVQYFIYDYAIFLLHLPASPLWPLLFLLTLALIFGVAYLWDRYVGNRYLTMGLPYLMRGQIQTAAIPQK